jgi:hypothetical protein
MSLNISPIGLKTPAASLAERLPPLSSRGHASGHIVVDDGRHRRIVLLESNLEFKWAIILDADPNVLEIKEQVRLDWPDTDRIRKHYFDFVVTMRSGDRVAFIVKPAKRALSPKFLHETRMISEHSARIGFVDEVRVLTDDCIDNTVLRNARFFRSVREQDELADEASAAITTDLVGAVPLAELASGINLGARGFRALVRQIAAGRLECIHHEVISSLTLVKRGSIQ